MVRFPGHARRAAARNEAMQPLREEAHELSKDLGKAAGARLVTPLLPVFKGIGLIRGFAEWLNVFAQTVEKEGTKPRSGSPDHE